MTDGGEPQPAQPQPGQPQHVRARLHPKPQRWAKIAAALGSGIGSGLLGTSLHGHALFVGGSVIPWGSALALLLLVSVGTFVGLWSRSAWVVVWCGAAAYATAGALSLQLGSVGLITGNRQGVVWLYGIAVATPVTALLVWRLLRVKRTRKIKRKRN